MMSTDTSLLLMRHYQTNPHQRVLFYLWSGTEIRGKITGFFRDEEVDARNQIWAWRIATKQPKQGDVTVNADGELTDLVLQHCKIKSVTFLDDHTFLNL